MSVIGPRPLLVEYLPYYTKEEHHRHDVTTIENPTYKVDGVLHYVVDHTPSLFHKTFTRNNSSVIIPYVEQLMLQFLIG